MFGGFATSVPDHPPPLDPPHALEGNIPGTNPPLRWSTCLSKAPGKFGFPVLFTSEEPTFIPTSFSQAVQVPCQQNAMTDELVTLEANQTWEHVTLLADTPVISKKWIWSIKVKSDGSLDCSKAHLVVQGYKQEYGIDYEEAFAPVAKRTTVWALLVVTAIRNWPHWQMDVKNSAWWSSRNSLHAPTSKLCMSSKAFMSTQEIFIWAQTSSTSMV